MRVDRGGRQKGGRDRGVDRKRSIEGGGDGGSRLKGIDIWVQVEGGGQNGFAEVVDRKR